MLFMVSDGFECLSMSFFKWFTNVGLDGTENMESLDCVTSGMFPGRMSGKIPITWCIYFRRRRLVRGNG